MLTYLTNEWVNEAWAHEVAAAMGIDLAGCHRPELCRSGPVVLDADNLPGLGFDLTGLLKALTDADGRCRVVAAHSYCPDGTDLHPLRKCGVPVRRRLPAALRTAARRAGLI
jgi:hypothetical protein